MSPYAKAALFTIRFAAFGLILLGLLLYSPDVALYMQHRPYSHPGMLALKAAPVVAGLALGLKARAIAIHLTKDLD